MNMNCRDAAAAAAWALVASAWSAPFVPAGQVQAFASASDLAVAATPSQVQIFQLPAGRLLAAFPFTGKVVAVAAGTEGAAWLVDQNGRRELRVKVGDAQPSSFPLPPGVKGERLAWVGGTAAVLGHQGGVLWDPWTRSWSQPEEVFPPEVAEQFKASHVQASPGGLVAFVRPFRLADFPGGRRTLSSASTWLSQSRSWRPLGTIATSAPRYRAIRGAKYDAQGRFVEAQFELSSTRLALDRFGLVGLEDEGLVRAPFLKGAWELGRLPLSGPAVQWSEQITAAGSSLYRLANGRLLEHDLERPGPPRALFPWGFAGPVSGLQSDGDQAWALTPQGPRAIGADPGQGWGFLSASLDPEPMTEEQAKLVASLNSWLGVPYVLGGMSRKGVDCSGLINQVFLDLGYALPRTSGQIKEAPSGKLVTDRLKVGDIIWTPGHVATYVGGGETIEAIRGGVKRSGIWRFKGAVVKRFLKSTLNPGP